MKIEVAEDYSYVLKEVFVPITLKTANGNELSICMRDEGFEISMLDNSIKNPPGVDSKHYNKYTAAGGFISPLYPPAAQSKADVHPCADSVASFTRKSRRE